MTVLLFYPECLLWLPLCILPTQWGQTPQLPSFQRLWTFVVSIFLPQRGAQINSSSRPINKTISRSYIHQHSHPAWPSCRALGTVPAWQTSHCLGRWHREPSCPCGCHRSHICLQTRRNHMLTTEWIQPGWEKADLDMISLFSPGSILPLMTPITLAELFTSPRLKMSSFTSLERRNTIRSGKQKISSGRQFPHLLHVHSENNSFTQTFPCFVLHFTCFIRKQSIKPFPLHVSNWTT